MIFFILFCVVQNVCVPYIDIKTYYWRPTDIENKLVITNGVRGGGTNWEVGINIYTLLCIN